MDFFYQNIICSFGVHNQNEVIFIQMPNDVFYRSTLKKLIPKAIWSSSLKIWYVKDNSLNRKTLYLPEKLYQGKDLLAKIHPINQPHLTSLINSLRLKTYSENTIKTYSIEFAQWLYVLNDYCVINTNPDQIKSYLLYCISTLKLTENQIHSRLNALKFFYEKVLNKETFFFEIPRPKKKNSLPKVLSTQEIKRLFNATTNLKHLMILKLGYGLGLRVSEISSLKINNIDSQRMLVHIQNSKGKKDRYVPLPESILIELREYYLTFKPQVYLFEYKPNQALSVRSIQLIFKTAKEKANINKQVGVHSLRHSYATHLLEYGTDMSIIQKLLGHNSVKTTEVYAKVSNTFLSKIRSPLDQLC